MNCLDICRKCPKRLVLWEVNGEFLSFMCREPKEYDTTIRSDGRRILDHVYALSKETGLFISPNDEFEERRKIKDGGHLPPFSLNEDQLLKAIIGGGKNFCPFVSDMQMMRWNND